MHDLLAMLFHAVLVAIVLVPGSMALIYGLRGTSVVRNGQWVSVRDRSPQHGEEEE